MSLLRKRKQRSKQKSALPHDADRPFKKSKVVEPKLDVDSFLDDSDNDMNQTQSSNIDDIINDVIEEEQPDRDAGEDDDNKHISEDDEDDDPFAANATSYDELDEFGGGIDDDDCEHERDEFDELAIADTNNNNNNNDEDDDDDDDADFLDFGHDNLAIMQGNADDDDNLNDDDLEAQRQAIEADAQREMYEEKQRNDALRKQEFTFVFPSYKRLLAEKTEPPNLTELKSRIETVLEVLSNFKLLHDGRHSRKEYVSLLSHAMARYYGYNLDLMNMFLAIFNANECLAFLEANEQQRPLTIRTNTLKCRRRDLAKLLIDRGVNLDPLATWSKSGLKINGSGGSSGTQVGTAIPIGATPEYLAGYYMIQSAASLLPTLALNIKPGQKVLDMCCAPGGKTTHCAQLMQDSGVLVANDVNHERLKAVYGNVHRMGFKNVVMCNLDGRQLGDHFGAIFDRVLLDAPCSCLGVIARDPSIKLSKKFNDVVTMSAVQKELILTAIDCCKVGGYVVYSTCSISPYENESVVNHAVEKRYVKVVETGLPFGERGFTKFKHMRFHQSIHQSRRYYPHIHNLDGFYVAKLLKCDKGKRDHSDRMTEQEKDDKPKL